jgi:putative IMPACT (imprinted ancient) family translation regulator
MMKSLQLESPARYLIPACEVRIENVVVNSRFIATAGPVFTVAQAKEFIKRVRSEYGDASHNVPVYIVGYGSSIVAHCSDDGEPAGTAGRPALAVLQGAGIGDIAIVITR